MLHLKHGSQDSVARHNTLRLPAFSSETTANNISACIRAQTQLLEHSFDTAVTARHGRLGFLPRDCSHMSVLAVDRGCGVLASQLYSAHAV